MPSLNASLPAPPSLAAGIVPAVPGQIPSLGAGGGGDFAAMMAPPEGPPVPDIVTYQDTAPTLPPGTTLPVLRQKLAGPPEPLPEVPVETVMIGTAAAPPPIDPAPAVPQDKAATTLPVSLPPAPAEDAPAPTENAPPEMAECRIDLGKFGGVSRRALARATVTPVTAPATLPQVVAPPLVLQKEIVAPVLTEPADGNIPQATTDKDVPEQSSESAEFVPAPPQVAPQPQPPFIPIEWTRTPAPRMLPPTSDDADIEAPAIATAQPVSGGAPAVPTLPGMPATSAESAPAATATPSAPPQLPQQLLADDGARQQTPLPPAAQPQPATPPHGFTLSPELAREVAELVRGATRERDDSAPAASLDRADAAAAPLSGLQSAATAPLHRDFAMSNRPAIDTSRAEWMQAMIERIAEMPQADGKREAQIRLRPDALGTVEVRIEQRQDRLHVTMNADNPQARQLLAESAPRLHELAEARGLRLGQTGIGGGEAHDRRPTPEQQDHAGPIRLRPAAAAAADSETETSGDLIA